MDYRKEAQILLVPILNDFKPQKPLFDKTCFIASNGPIIEQFTNDGKLNNGESLDDRINKIINSTKVFMKEHNYQDVDNNYFYYTTYNNGIFDFKLYVQDLVNDKTVVRSINVFFLEPRNNNVYLLNVSGGPFALPTDTLKIGTVDSEDKVTNQLFKVLNVILTNLKYR